MSSHPVDIHVGKRIRLRRSILGMSQDELGKKIGVTFQQIQKYERGINRVSSSRLYEFAHILNKPVEFFFEGFKEDGANVMAGFAESDTPVFETNSSADSKETLAIIRAYNRIQDPAVRKSVLALMKAIAAPVEGSES